MMYVGVYFKTKEIIQQIIKKLWISNIQWKIILYDLKLFDIINLWNKCAYHYGFKTQDLLNNDLSLILSIFQI